MRKNYIENHSRSYPPLKTHQFLPRVQPKKDSTCSVNKCFQERNLPFLTIFTVMQMQGNDHVMQQTLLPANMTRISIIKNHQTHLTQE
jgi:hypothetical protein